MVYREGGRHEYGGHLAEYDTLGECNLGEEYLRAWKERSEQYLKRSGKQGSMNGYLPYKESLDIIREHINPDRALEPERSFANDLRIEVIDELGFGTDEDMDRVRYYPAGGKWEQGKGSALDRFHGVDAWIEVETSEGPLVVTLDASKKVKSYNPDYVAGEGLLKADLWVPEVPDTPDETDKMIQSLARQVVTVLKKKASERRGGTELLNQNSV